tara:strand:- start:4517 stop:4903 length:387 start_codon:yes stop_codon:yes gene_type:complete
MSRISKGLFDPRRKMQYWPEPNDDPNIPYVWGLSGYSHLGNPTTEAPADDAIISPKEPVQDVEATHAVIDSRIGGMLIGVSVVMGAAGFVEGITESDSESVVGKFTDGILTGISYSTIVGFLGRKYMR